MMTEWHIPTSMREARERKRIITAEIEEIEAQLGDPLKRKDYFSEIAFMSWRKGAVWAHTNRLQELRLLKQWIREHLEDNLCVSCGDAL
jgi:hypothetical protein